MGSGKYVSGESGRTYSPGVDKCGEGAATAYDMNSMICYPIYGVAITIGPKSASWQGLFEVCNMNWHMMDTRTAVATLTQLSGYMKA
jgi:hypothetical protein